MRNNKISDFQSEKKTLFFAQPHHVCAGESVFFGEKFASVKEKLLLCSRFLKAKRLLTL